MAHVQPGRVEDLEQLNALYNHYVRETHITFDIEPITMEQRLEWFGNFGARGRHRLLVAAAEEQVVGYAASDPVHPRQAYETSVATSVYVAPDSTGRGLGSLLYTALFDALAGEDLHRAYAGVAIPNPASIALHERFDFRQVAYFTEQGRKLGRYWDVAWFEKPLG